MVNPYYSILFVFYFILARVFFCGPIIFVDFGNLKIEAARAQIITGMGAGVRGRSPLFAYGTGKSDRLS